MSARELAARVRRFIPLAARSIRWDLQIGVRSLRESARRVAKSIRRAWWQSDPVGWAKLFDEIIAPTPEQAAAREQHRQRLAAARAHFRSNGASFSGTLRARVADRGMRLGEGESEHDLDQWLCDQLGLDGWHGDQIDVRIVIQPLDDQGQTQS